LKNQIIIGDVDCNYKVSICWSQQDWRLPFETFNCVYPYQSTGKNNIFLSTSRNCL